MNTIKYELNTSILNIIKMNSMIKFNTININAIKLKLKLNSC